MRPGCEPLPAQTTTFPDGWLHAHLPAQSTKVNQTTLADSKDIIHLQVHRICYVVYKNKFYPQSRKFKYPRELGTGHLRDAQTALTSPRRPVLLSTGYSLLRSSLHRTKLLSFFLVISNCNLTPVHLQTSEQQITHFNFIRDYKETRNQTRTLQEADSSALKNIYKYY